MCAAEAGTSWSDWLDCSLPRALALIEAIRRKIEREDAMQANIARTIYLCAPGKKRPTKLSHFALFSDLEA